MTSSFQLGLLALTGTLALQVLAQPVTQPVTSGQVYLRCPANDEPEGVNDIHVDFEKKIITNSFASTRQFREDGPFLVSETFAEIDGKATVVTTLRVNRYTYSYEFLWPMMKVYKRLQCTVLDKRF